MIFYYECFQRTFFPPPVIICDISTPDFLLSHFPMSVAENNKKHNNLLCGIHGNNIL